MAGEQDGKRDSRPKYRAHQASSRSTAPALLLCQGGVRFECVEDDACELSFEAADRFAAAFAFPAFALEVSARGGVATRLCDRDAVERRVELAVAAAVEPVALDPA